MCHIPRLISHSIESRAPGSHSRDDSPWGSQRCHVKAMTPVSTCFRHYPTLRAIEHYLCLIFANLSPCVTPSPVSPRERRLIPRRFHRGNREHGVAKGGIRLRRRPRSNSHFRKAWLRSPRSERRAIHQPAELLAPNRRTVRRRMRTLRHPRRPTNSRSGGSCRHTDDVGLEQCVGNDLRHRAKERCLRTICEHAAIAGNEPVAISSRVRRHRHDRLVER